MWFLSARLRMWLPLAITLPLTRFLVHRLAVAAGSGTHQRGRTDQLGRDGGFRGASRRAAAGASREPAAPDPAGTSSPSAPSRWTRDRRAPRQPS